jgi:hypothetical protein
MASAFPRNSGRLAVGLTKPYRLSEGAQGQFSNAVTALYVSNLPFACLNRLTATALRQGAKSLRPVIVAPLSRIPLHKELFRLRTCCLWEPRKAVCTPVTRGTKELRDDHHSHYRSASHSARRRRFLWTGPLVLKVNGAIRRPVRNCPTVISALDMSVLVKSVGRYPSPSNISFMQ